MFPAPLTAPVLFNTPEADAVLSGLQILPRDNAWNERIDNRPLLTNSAAMISQIISDLASDRRTLRPFYEMNYVLVPDSQPTRPIQFVDYPDESDLDGGTDPSGLYPIPDNLPVETVAAGHGDAHPAAMAAGCEWLGRRSALDHREARRRIDLGDLADPRVGTAWQASNGAKFPLNSNALRPAGWTSADAAGLSMFSGLVRYDECARGMVEHAIRLVVRRTRRTVHYPATHFASTPHRSKLPGDGPAPAIEGKLHHPGHLDDSRESRLQGAQKIRCDRRGQWRLLLESVSLPTTDSRPPASTISPRSALAISR
jgi:hypothetical protein